MEVLVIVLAVLLVGAGAVVLLRGPRQEDLSSHHDENRDETTSQRLYRGSDRPAGPDAEM